MRARVTGHILFLGTSKVCAKKSSSFWLESELKNKSLKYEKTKTYLEVTYIGAERGSRHNRQRGPGVFLFILWISHQIFDLLFIHYDNMHDNKRSH